MSVDEPHRVGSDHAHPVASDSPQELLLQGVPLLVGLGETRRDDHERPHPCDGTVVHDRQNGVPRDCHDGQIGPRRDRTCRGIGRQRPDVRRVRVHRVDRTEKASGNERVENAGAETGGVAGGADECNGPWLEEGVERGRGEDAVPHFRAADAVLAGGDGEVDLDALILDLRVERKARLAERLEHRLVLDSGQGPEAEEAVPGRQQGQPLEEAPQTLPLEPVVDREGDLGGVRVARDIGGRRDDPRLAADDAAHDQRQLRPGIG